MHIVLLLKLGLTLHRHGGHLHLHAHHTHSSYQGAVGKDTIHQDRAVFLVMSM